MTKNERREYWKSLVEESIMGTEFPLNCKCLQQKSTEIRWWCVPVMQIFEGLASCKQWL